MSVPAAEPFLDPGTTVRLRSDGLAWRQVVDDVVLLDTGAGRYHSVNATGAVLWERIAAGTTVGELVDILTEHYPSAAGRAADDIAAFLSELASRDFVETAGAAPSP